MWDLSINLIFHTIQGGFRTNQAKYRRKNQNRGALKESCIWDRTINPPLKIPLKKKVPCISMEKYSPLYFHGT